MLRKSILRPGRLLGLLLTTPLVILRLARVIRSVAPDAVYVNTITLPHWIVAARLARRPVLVHVHEAEEMTSPRLRRLLYAPLRAAQVVVVNSATTARVVTRACPRVGDRLVEIPNGVPDEGVDAADAVVPGRLLIVSRLSPRKGVDVALESMAKLLADRRDVTLTVCGDAFAGYEWFADQLRARAAQPDLAGRVTFTGFLESVRPELAAAQVVLAPSFGESFGNAAVEAMLAGRPVIVSDVQGLGEIVDDGETGVAVPAGDPAALADAVGRILDDRELADRLARRGRAVAAERYSITRYRYDVVAAVERTCGTGGRALGVGRAAVLVGLALVVLLAGCSGSGGSHRRSASNSGATTPGNVITPSAGGSGASSSSPVVPTLHTTVPAPNSGNVHQRVSSQPVRTKSPVPLASAASFDASVTGRIASHSVIAGKATRPGEVSGPALRLTLMLRNASNRSVSLDDTVVTVKDARGTPLVPLSGPQTAPFHGRMAARKSATATYVFVLSHGRHNPYTVGVSYSASAAVVQFVGDAA